MMAAAPSATATPNNASRSPASLRMLHPLLSFLLGVACGDDDVGPLLFAGAGVAPSVAPFAGTLTAAPPAKIGPSPPLSMSWFGGVHTRVHAVLVLAS
jgi:hypothetical protein